jgi:hypothetical protein
MAGTADGGAGVMNLHLALFLAGEFAAACIVVALVPAWQRGKQARDVLLAVNAILAEAEREAAE